MKKLASLSIILLALALLSGCKSGKGATGPKEEDPVVVGSATLHLPVLPKNFLAKNAASPTRAMFVLTISGSGMITRKQAWPLSSTPGAPVQVNNIPVGARLFVGELDVDGVITHSDSVWARIEGGKTTQVNLKLTSASGNAVICVEIEGVSLPDACRPVREYPDISGCYQVSVTGGVGAASGFLTIAQDDSLLTGVITWADGAADTSRGLIRPDGTFFFGLSGLRTLWSYKGVVALTNPKDGFRGPGFVHELRGLSGYFTVLPAFCPGNINPGPGTLSNVECFAVSQTFEDGSASSGGLTLANVGGATYGIFAWTGHGVYRGKGEIRSQDRLGDDLRMVFPVPASVYANPGGNPTARYTAILTPGMGLFDAKIYWNADTALVSPIGTWKSQSRACGNEDRKLLQSEFGL